jgi:Zn-dependent M28 family amino/carboxypeptidase
MRFAISIIFILSLLACNKKGEEIKITEESEKFTSKYKETNPTGIDSGAIMRHIDILASDEFEGRFPATQGEIKTIDYISSEFEKMGIKPGNGDSYLQEFNITEMRSNPNEMITVKGNGKSIDMKWKDDFVAQTRKPGGNKSIKNAELVFCGYGISAPEYNWNDFEGIDMSDKIAVVFVNDPGFATQDPQLFTGNNMTYYGRWTYKYEEAARQDCLGLMIIHEDDAAGYPWEVVRNGWSGTEMVVLNENGNNDLATLEGWFSKGKAEEIFQANGKTFKEMKEMALDENFKPMPLGMTISIDISLQTTPTTTNNIIGMIEGSKRPDEYLIYMGHWDHYGIDESLEGDQILNGARDNASGVAGILEIAQTFANADQKPERSILFMFVGAEEQGLLGSKFYGANPLKPLNQTVMCINIDGLNIWGDMGDIVQIGKGQSPDLDSLMEKHFGEAGMTVKYDPDGEKGYFYRSDHFSLAKYGVPAIYTHIGYDHKEKGEEWAKKVIDDWTANIYHKPGDEIDENWVMSGAVKEMQILYYLGSDLANSNFWPKWSVKSEFKAIREESIK